MDCILGMLEICQKMYLYSTLILLTLRINKVNKGISDTAIQNHAPFLGMYC